MTEKLKLSLLLSGTYLSEKLDEINKIPRGRYKIVFLESAALAPLDEAKALDSEEI